MADCVFGLLVVPKKNTKSNAWLHFALLATEDGKAIESELDKPVCKVCGKRVLAKASKTTDIYEIILPFLHQKDYICGHFELM